MTVPQPSKQDRPPLQTLKRRADFLRIRSGNKWSGVAFLAEGRMRTDPVAGRGIRFGFTVTKKIGGAVVRNRIRRRLRDAVRDALGALSGDRATIDIDIVVVARRPAENVPFEKLRKDVGAALKSILDKTAREVHTATRA